MVRIEPPGQPSLSFFFPYGIQIVDQKAYYNNLLGQASHQTYKQRQLEAARIRVLDSLREPEDGLDKRSAQSV